MHSRGRRGLAPALVFLSVSLWPSAARAQAGIFVTPSFSAGAVYDDNVFATPSQRVADVISRFTPGLQVGYRSAPLTLLVGYSLEAEVFADNPELTEALARQEASVDLRALPVRELTLSLAGAYITTQAPGEFNLETGLVAGRVRAKRLSLRPSLRYEFDGRTAGRLDYALTRDEVEEGVATDSQVASLGLDRRLTPLDTGALDYTLRRFVSDGDATTSHGLTVGWTRELTRVTRLALRGGPRLSEGTVGPEVSASVHHRLQLGELSFTYTRSEATAIGRAGSVTTEGFVAGLTYRPLQSLDVSAGPSFVRSEQDGLEARVYGVNAEVTYQLTRWLSLRGSYTFTFQQESLGAARPGGEEILRNVFLLRLTATAPYRLP